MSQLAAQRRLLYAHRMHCLKLLLFSNAAESDVNNACRALTKHWEQQAMTGQDVVWWNWAEGQLRKQGIELRDA
jgi:hypothetical protein|tara:strand:+ start:339 stop:560 length:222 start_codon:yes stop_codon:yes gene_type:complete